MGLAAVDREGTESTFDDSSPETQILSVPVTDRFLPLRGQIFVASFCALNLLLAKIFINYVAPAAEGVSVLWGVLWIALSTVALAVCFPPLLAKALKDVRAGEFSVEAAKTLIVVLLTVSSVYALFFQFETLLAAPLYSSLPWVLLALTLEQYLFVLFERSALDNTDFSLLRIGGRVRRLEPYPDHAPVEALVSGDVIKPGELFKVGVGEVIPCDGIIIEGLVELRERRYSGAGTVRFKSKGHRVFAGSEVVQGEALCESSALADDSTVTSFTQALNERIRQSSDKFDVARTVELRFGLILVAVAICVGTYAYGAGETVGSVANTLACVLTFALLLRAPRMWAYLPGLIHTTAFRQGLLLKESSVLDALAGVKHLVLDYRVISPPGQVSVKSVDLLDERIDRDGLLSVLLLMFGSSDDERATVITEHLRSLVKKPTLHRLSDLHAYESRGRCANVGGVEFTVGSETFLLERGVHVQLSEVVQEQEGEECLYVAMQEEVVARILLSPRFSVDAKQMECRLSDFGVRSILCSPDHADEVDKAGKRAGFELAAIHGGLQDEQFREKLTSHSPCAFFVGDYTLPALAEAAEVTISVFDDVRWNLARADIVLLNPALDRISTAFRIARTARSVRFGGLALLGISFVLATYAMTWGSVASAGLLAPILVLGVFLAALNHFRLLLRNHDATTPVA